MSKNINNLTLEDTLKEALTENIRKERWGELNQYLPFIGVVCAVFALIIGLAISFIF